MSKQLLIWMLICLNGTDYAYAQWTKKDSARLQDILSGKEKLQLNSETMKAIQSGTLINADKPVGTMRMAPAAPVPFYKDFSSYVHRADTGMKVVDYRSMPPALFMKYGPQYVEELRVFKIMRQQIRQEFPTSGGALRFSVADLTSRKHHVHKRNSKRSDTWKNYNNLPTPDIIKKRKKFAGDHPEAVLATDSLKLAGAARKDSVFFPGQRDSIPEIAKGDSVIRPFLMTDSAALPVLRTDSVWIP